MPKVVSKLNVANKFSDDSALSDAWLPSYSDKSSLLADQADDLIHIPTPRNVVFDSAEHVSVVARVRV